LRDIKNGWTRKVSEVRRQSVQWANSGNSMAMMSVCSDHISKAEGPEKITASFSDAMRDPNALSTAGAIIGAVGAALDLYPAWAD